MASIGGELRGKFLNCAGAAPSDPAPCLLVVSVLAIVAALACGLPARRAARSAPAALLRFE